MTPSTLKPGGLRAVPATLIEVLERRLVTANEAEVIKALRHSTKNADPVFSASALGAIARAALP